MSITSTKTSDFTQVKGFSSSFCPIQSNLSLKAEAPIEPKKPRNQGNFNSEKNLATSISDVCQHLIVRKELSEEKKSRLMKHLDPKELPSSLQKLLPPNNKRLSPLKKLTTSIRYSIPLWKSKHALGVKQGEETQSFSLQTVISKGSFGKVYKALDLEEKPVALKIMDCKEAWEMESRNLQELQGAPNLVKHISSYETSIDSLTQEGSNFAITKIPLYAIATEYIPYPTLDKAFYSFAEPAPASFQDIAALTWQILACLEGLEKKKAVHCDLKPQNILAKRLSQEEADKLPPLEIDPNISPSFQDAIRRLPTIVLDVGIARKTGEHLNYAQSRYYRSPGPIMKGPLNTNADLFSLGCVLHELFTNSYLFESDSLIAMLQKNQNSTFYHNLIHLMLVFSKFPPSSEVTKKYNDSYFLSHLGSTVFNHVKKAIEAKKQRHIARLQETKERLAKSPEDLAIFNELNNFIVRLLDYEKEPNIAEIMKHPFLKRFTSRLSI